MDGGVKCSNSHHSPWTLLHQIIINQKIRPTIEDYKQIKKEIKSKKLTGRSEITRLIALQAPAVAPVCMAFIDTSMRKKNTAGIGSRTWKK